MAGCLKCGKEVAEGAVFCEECLAVMHRYPVKTGAVAVIQDRPAQRNYILPEDPQDTEVKARLHTLQTTVRWLIVLTVILSALLLTMTGMLLHSTQSEPEKLPIGKNYTTIGQSLTP